MKQFRLLVAYAHPDDESFGSGGLIAKYATENVQVDYLCATNGELGTVSDAITADVRSVTDIRASELDCASRVLGIHQVIKLGYRDSGMMNSTTSNEPGCLWFEWNHSRDRVIKQIVDVIREHKPHVVVTFNRYGGYGHPDHIAIQGATSAAFKLAGDIAYTASNFDVYQPQKLYYASLPADRFLRFYLMFLKLRGKDIRRMGVNHDLDYQAVLDHLEPIHTKIDVSKYMHIWDAASDCHVSQGQGRGSGTRGMTSSLPIWLRHKLASKYGLTRIYPEPDTDYQIEHDLFEQVALV